MPNIDRFIQAIQQFGADRLVVAAGQKVTLVVGAEKRCVSSQPASLRQVEDLLKEILPADRMTILAAPGEHEFDYDSPSGRVRVNTTMSADALEVPSIMQTSKSMGMTTLNDSLMDLVARGIIDPSEAYAKSAVKSELKGILSRGGFQVEAA